MNFIHADELQSYSLLDFKIEKFFRKLDNKVKKKASSGYKRFTVLVYDEFNSNMNIFTLSQEQSFKDSLYIDYIIKDPDLFISDNRSLFLTTIQQKLVHKFGYYNVSWNSFDNSNISNGMVLEFYWR